MSIARCDLTKLDAHKNERSMSRLSKVTALGLYRQTDRQTDNHRCGRKHKSVHAAFVGDNKKFMNTFVHI